MVRCAALLYSTLLCFASALQCFALHCFALHCIALRSTALHCTALHCTALHCTALHCAALRCTALHCAALRCTALHCAAFCTDTDKWISRQLVTAQQLTVKMMGDLNGQITSMVYSAQEGAEAKKFPRLRRRNFPKPRRRNSSIANTLLVISD